MNDSFHPTSLRAQIAAADGRSSAAARIDRLTDSVAELADWLHQLDEQQVRFECLVSDRIEQLARERRQATDDAALARWAAGADGLG